MLINSNQWLIFQKRRLKAPNADSGLFFYALRNARAVSVISYEITMASAS